MLSLSLLECFELSALTILLPEINMLWFHLHKPNCEENARLCTLSHIRYLKTWKQRLLHRGRNEVVSRPPIDVTVL